MKRIAVWTLAGLISTVAVADDHVAVPELTAAQIVEKNVAARGGLDAWRKIQTMVWIGHIESANAPSPSLPFAFELKRPNKTRFEIRSQNQLSVRIYDGAHGWKVRPGGNGMPQLQAYSADELSAARDGGGIDGPLMDYQAKGVAVALDGRDEVEGRKAYRLSLTLPSGARHHVWIDAQNFLDIKYDRSARNSFGQTGTVAVFYRNYKTIDGLQIPSMIESGVGSGKVTDKMVIDKVLLNPPLDDRMFAKPNLPGARGNMVSVDAEPSPQAARPAFRPLSSLPPGFPGSKPRPLGPVGVK